MPVSIRALCSSHLNTASFHAAWRKRSAAVAVRFRSDSLLCVDGAQMLKIPAACRGFFYSLPSAPVFSSPVGAPHI